MAQFGLLGGRLAHSLSPQIHQLLHGFPYDLFELPEKEVAPFLEKRGFDAINVTIPYKKTVMPYCSRMSENARRIGSVNTIRKEADGSLSGFNTDYYGFSYLLRRAQINPEGKKALILGSGGSSVTVNAVLRDLGAREVVVISRSGRYNYTNLSLHTDAQIIVNTTPVGMFPQNGEKPLTLDHFPRMEAVADIIYNPLKTALLLEAENRGLLFDNGLSMLVAQAKAAAEIFLNKMIDDSEIERVLGALTEQTRNIVLIGMPGCGKSTVAALLGEMLGREVADTDKMIEDMTRRSIPDILTQDGEEEFRRLESQAVSEAGKRLGVVIATGGGVVTRARNYAPLRQNGFLVYLDRPLCKLATDSRPLSSDRARLETLAKTRLPLYQKWADLTVKVQDGPANVANSIVSSLNTL